MAHLHSVYDGDTHFKIIPVSRKIENTTGKVILMQNDHNSERFTFEIPRYIEGHDMSICNKVEVHYNNTDTKTKDVNKDVYEATDLQVSPDSEDVVICSWLISGNATKYAGSLYFVLRFACLTDSTIDYQWFTDIYKDITISKSIFNTETVAIDNSDILEQWKAEIEALFNSGGSGSGGGVAESVVNEKIATAKREIIGGADDLTDADTIHAAKNLARGLVNGLESKVVKTTELNNAINSALLQAKESGEFDGVDGKDGAAGKDGQDGANGLSAYQIWLQQGNTGSEADFLESLKGADGASGKDGASGSDGKDGKDGASVTVSSVTESTADGGENVVTFSNGQTLKVKNGSKGSTGDKGETGAAGYTPQKGVDYWTEEDKAGIISSVIETLGGNPIFGYVDENNNIVVQGNLSDGTYSVKYEMEDGSTIDIGNLELDSNVYYSVTNNLTNCINNNNATQAVQGGSYSATITANSGYELSYITVTMGGVNISSSAVSEGNITIANVTGNIAITAIAEEIVVEPTNLLPQAIFNTSEDPVNSDKGYVSGYKISTSGGGLSQVTGCYSSGYIEVDINDTVTIKNITLRSDGNTNNIVLYSNTNKGSKIIGKPGPTGAFDSGVTVSNGVYSFTPSTFASADSGVEYFRFSCGGITDDTIVTVTKAKT